MQKEQVGLRERKRLETRAQIESAAVRLVLENGLENTTVDAISAAADISPRTFFNYFDSKEDALLGLPDVRESAAVIRERTAADGAGSEGISRFLVRLFLEIMRSKLQNPEAREGRNDLVVRYPQLLGRIFTHIGLVTDQLTEAVREIAREQQQRQRQQPRPGSPEHPSDDDDALWPEVTVAICVAAVRAAVKETVAAGQTDELEGIEERANTLIAIALEKLSN